MPFPDGTNDEKEEVNPPLEWKSKDDLTNVTLHQMKVSPPCVKIRTYLKYFDVPFKEVNKKRKGSAYQKVPHLVVGERQINDSYIIIKNLVPVLTGQPFDENWEKIITFELQLSMEAECFADKQSATQFLKMAGVPGCVACCIAGKVLGGIPKKIREKNPDLRPSAQIGAQFAGEMGSNQFVGGDKPSQADISYYGTVVAFMKAGCPKAREHLKDSGLNEWWGRMEAIMPNVL